MVIDIFSSFDIRLIIGPKYFLIIRLRIVTRYIFFGGSIWASLNQLFIIIIKTIEAIFRFKKVFIFEQTINYDLKGTIRILGTIFIFLIFTNFRGLIPYYIRYRRQGFFCVYLSITFMNISNLI